MDIIRPLLFVSMVALTRARFAILLMISMSQLIFLHRLRLILHLSDRSILRPIFSRGTTGILIVFPLATSGPSNELPSSSPPVMVDHTPLPEQVSNSVVPATEVSNPTIAAATSDTDAADSIPENTLELGV